jgi:hypothetical protein
MLLFIHDLDSLLNRVIAIRIMSAFMLGVVLSVAGSFSGLSGISCTVAPAECAFHLRAFVVVLVKMPVRCHGIKQMK